MPACVYLIYYTQVHGEGNYYYDHTCGQVKNPMLVQMTLSCYWENRSNVLYVLEMLDFLPPNPPSPAHLASPFYFFLLPGCLLLCYDPVKLTSTVPEAFAFLVFQSHPEELMDARSCTCRCSTQIQLPAEKWKASNWPLHLIQPFTPRTKGNNKIFWDQDRMLVWCVLPSKHKPTSKGLHRERWGGEPSCAQPLAATASNKTPSWLLGAGLALPTALVTEGTWRAPHTLLTSGTPPWCCRAPSLLPCCGRVRLELGAEQDEVT